MARRKNVKVEEVKAAKTVVEAAPAAEETVAEASVEVVAEAPAEAAAEKKAPAKRAAKKTAAAKSAAKRETKKTSADLFIQYPGIQVSYTELVEKAKAFAGVADPKSVNIYVKPEDYKVYYVIDEDNIGDFAL